MVEKPIQSESFLIAFVLETKHDSVPHLVNKSEKFETATLTTRKQNEKTSLDRFRNAFDII